MRKFLFRPTTKIYIPILTASSTANVHCLKGTVLMACMGDTGEVQFELKGTLLSQGFAKNLVCMNQMVEMGFKPVFNKNESYLIAPDRKNRI